MNAKASRAYKGPKFIRYFVPVIQAMKEIGGSARSSDVIERVAKLMNVPESEQKEVLKSGILKFDNQVHWARIYLVWAGYIDGSKRGIWSLTESGWKLGTLSESDVLALFKTVHAARKGISGKTDSPRAESHANGDTENPLPLEEDKQPLLEPEEDAEDSHAHVQAILNHLRRLTPTGFERFCVRLLTEHGFEGVKPTGGPRDKGIDGVGVLRINPFVSFSIVFQCKRYSAQTTVTSKDISAFRGSIPNSIDKGIFITTSSFTADARSIARDTDKKPIELISGEDLVNLMEEKALGLYKTFKIDQKFFKEFEFETPET